MPRQIQSKKQFTERRKFLIKSSAVGGTAIASAAMLPATPVFGVSTSESTSNTTNPRTARLSNITADDFSHLREQVFHLETIDGITLNARLIDIETPKARQAPRFRREIFSVVFDIDGDQTLTDANYLLSHPRLGRFELFMSPVDLPQKHRRLQAVFS